MEQIVQQYIQAKGLNEQQAQQLIQELQQLDEQQLQQVIENMQQQLQGNNKQEEMMQYGGIPVSMDGLYEYENTPVIVPNGNITMEGINYPVDAYDADSGEFLQTMQPNQNYQFDVDNVLEIPKGKFGISKMQSGGRSKNFYENYIDKNGEELKELELLESNRKAGYLNGEQSKRLIELKNKHGKFNKDFNRASKLNTVNSPNNGFSLEEEKEFNQLLKKERADKRKLTIAENKRLEQLKAEQERLDALKPLAEKPLKRKRTYAGATINQIREENNKYLEEAKKRDAKLEKQGFQFKPKDITKEPVTAVKPSTEQLIPNQKQDLSIIENQRKIQNRGETIKLISEKLKDPNLTKVQKDALFLELQKLTKENTILPKSSKFNLKKSAINIGENVLDAVEGLARNKWINRASDILGTIGGTVGAGLTVLDLYNTAEEGRGSVGALEFLNDNTPLGKKYQKLYEDRINRESIYNADQINRDLGNAYYEERKKQNIKNIPNLQTQNTNQNPVTNYFKQPESKYQLPSKFNISTTTPVQNQNLSTSTNENRNRDEFGFVKDLSKVKDKSRKDNINDYKSWVNEWDSVILNFKSLSYPEQQKQALDWIKKNQGKLDYKGVLGQLNNWGYKDSPDKLLTDGMFAEGTNLMRPSNLIGKTDISPISPLTPKGITSTTPKLPSSEELQKKVVVPKKNDEELDIQDVFLGKLDNKDYSGRYLSNMKLRNNNIKMPYFGRIDLKNPSLYTQNISPYLNQLYAANNAARQNLDMNSAVGQSAQIQLGANMLDRINDVSGKVYNTNMQQTVNWENALADIYNKQQQYDDNSRKQYDDDVNRTLANKQNIDNEIDKMAYEFKQTGIRNKNNLLLSQMLHPNYVIEEDGTMKRKGEKFNKGYNDYLEKEVKRLAEENKKLKAKYGIKKK